MIIDAAERVAAEIRTDAEAEAERYLERAKRNADRLTMERVRLISELTDSLFEHASQVRQQCEALIESLDDAMRGIAAVSSEGRVAIGRDPDRVQRVPARESTAAAYLQRVPEEAPGERLREAPEPPALRAEGADASEAALLRATQMAVAGSDRAEIARTLVSDLGIDEPDGVLDRILGPDRGA